MGPAHPTSTASSADRLQCHECRTPRAGSGVRSIRTASRRGDAMGVDRIITAGLTLALGTALACAGPVMASPVAAAEGRGRRFAGPPGPGRHGGGNPGFGPSWRESGNRPRLSALTLQSSGRHGAGARQPGLARGAPPRARPPGPRVHPPGRPARICPCAGPVAGPGVRGTGQPRRGGGPRPCGEGRGR